MDNNNEQPLLCADEMFAQQQRRDLEAKLENATAGLNTDESAAVQKRRRSSKKRSSKKLSAIAPTPIIGLSEGDLGLIATVVADGRQKSSNPTNRYDLIDLENSNNNRGNGHERLLPQGKKQEENSCLHFMRDYACVMLTDDVGSPKSVCLGLNTLFILGVTVAVLFPLRDNTGLKGIIWPILSAIIGYTYFLAWSISFYPQALLNHQRRSTTGLSIDFCLLNFFGHTCYCIYNSSFFWSPTIQEEYRSRHSGSDNLVEINDVAFSIHACLLSGLTLYQVWLYDDWKTNPSSIYTKVTLFSMTAIAVISASFIGYGLRGQWLNLVYALSVFKIMITCMKYIPQIMLNSERKSTVGWNIWGMLLDLVGGVLSTVQLFGDAINVGDVKDGVFGNSAKLGLGALSIVFDVVLIVQHYVLYPDTEKAVKVTEQ